MLKHIMIKECRCSKVSRYNNVVVGKHYDRIVLLLKILIYNDVVAGRYQGRGNVIEKVRWWKLPGNVVFVL